jgi:hypothetical protein
MIVFSFMREKGVTGKFGWLKTAVVKMFARLASLAGEGTANTSCPEMSA